MNRHGRSVGFLNTILARAYSTLSLEGSIAPTLAMGTFGSGAAALGAALGGVASGAALGAGSLAGVGVDPEQKKGFRSARHGLGASWLMRSKYANHGHPGGAGDPVRDQGGGDMDRGRHQERRLAP